MVFHLVDGGAQRRFGGAENEFERQPAQQRDIVVKQPVGHGTVVDATSTKSVGLGIFRLFEHGIVDGQDDGGKLGIGPGRHPDFGLGDAAGRTEPLPSGLGNALKLSHGFGFAGRRLPICFDRFSVTFLDHRCHQQGLRRKLVEHGAA